MFTINQIKEAHSKVKSGADFPSYVQALRLLGVQRYDHYVSDGHIIYQGVNDFQLSGEAKWPAREVNARGDIHKLKHDLIVHQQGNTDYPTFCKQAAENGVDKWRVDMIKMKCIYYDRAGNEMLEEEIPSV